MVKTKLDFFNYLPPLSLFLLNKAPSTGKECVRSFKKISLSALYLPQGAASPALETRRAGGQEVGCPTGGSRPLPALAGEGALQPSAPEDPLRPREPFSGRNLTVPLFGDKIHSLPLNWKALTEQFLLFQSSKSQGIINEERTRVPGPASTWTRSVPRASSGARHVGRRARR